MFLRQLLYISSSAAPAIGDNLSTILLQSRRNNPTSELTGLLWTLIGDRDERIAGALRKADPVVRGHFEGLIQARKAA